MLVTAASCDITPTGPCPLAGFAGRSGNYEGKASSLEANVVAFHDGSRCAAILAIDSLFVGSELENLLSNHFERSYGQSRRDFLVMASHTHFAPALDCSKPALGHVDSDYFSSVVSRCLSLVDTAMDARPQSSRLERRDGSSNAAINRRLNWPLPRLAGGRVIGPQAVMAPNPAGPVDPRITIWSLAAESGRPLALIWHFACHPTGYPVARQVTADFPGMVRSKLRAHFGLHLPVIFLQGFAGDLRPRVPETRSMMTRLLERSVFGPSFNHFSIDGWNEWAGRLAADVVGILQQARREVVEEAGIASATHSIPLRKVIEPGNDRPVHFRRLKVGARFDLVAVSAEPLTSLGSLIRWKDATPLGYVGDVFGYWPSDADAAWGGYEVNHFLGPFGLTGRLRPSLDFVFAEAVERLGQPR